MRGGLARPVARRRRVAPPPLSPDRAGAAGAGFSYQRLVFRLHGRNNALSALVKFRHRMGHASPMGGCASVMAPNVSVSFLRRYSCTLRTFPPFPHSPQNILPSCFTSC